MLNFNLVIFSGKASQYDLRGNMIFQVPYAPNVGEIFYSGMELDEYIAIRTPKSFDEGQIDIMIR